LTRVRRFQQDDAHIFCRIDQVFLDVISIWRINVDPYIL
jgi:threonyl-tRNA synthetase